MQNLISTEKLPDFRVNCNRERIVIQIPAHPESFSFIAQIIQEIDDFSMTFVSDKSTLSADNTVSQEVESDDKDESNDTVAESKVEKGSQVKQVRDYMLSMSFFTVKDLKRYFPNLTTGTINNALYLAKKKGLITETGMGEYRINKT